VNTLLTTIDGPGPLELYVGVPVERAGQLRLGQPVELVGPEGDVQAQSRVDFISPSVSTGTQSVLVKATFPNVQGALRPSQYARARLVWGVRQTVTLPILSVSRVNGQFFVFVVEGKGEAAVARQRLVRLGEPSGNNYPVLDGIMAGEHVVVQGGQPLFDGAPVAETVQEGSASR
jgi:RND family efflux transporter MFP subunit